MTIGFPWQRAGNVVNISKSWCHHDLQHGEAISLVVSPNRKQLMWTLLRIYGSLFKIYFSKFLGKGVIMREKSHYTDVTWPPWRPRSLAIQVFVQQFVRQVHGCPGTKQTQGHLHPSCRPQVDYGVPLIRVHNSYCVTAIKYIIKGVREVANPSFLCHSQVIPFHGVAIWRELKYWGIV